ncbi:uncharacterized protein LOC129790106 [Lutzomyia longipalpis]|uniref:uncharacterized protein LOC129790106 n=1 Tax=Lutzomyia longipalpis TaxID=7200 RepID=UPI0024834C6D|nr:uncharacterized protein LOC129790106 [Lutzomyia longipalpis]
MSRKSFDASSMDISAHSQVEEERTMETIWAVLESTIMGTIPEHIKSCLTKNGFTSISVIAQINDADIEKLDENLSRDPCNGYSSLRLGDRKLLSCLPQLIESNQDQIYGQWHERIGEPLLPIEGHRAEGSIMSPVSQVQDVTDEQDIIQEVQENDTSELDIKIHKYPRIRKYEEISRSPTPPTPERLVDPALTEPTADEREYERQLRRQVNTFIKVNTLEPRTKIDQVVVRLTDNHITAYCMCPKCHRKISISATPKKKSEGTLGFKLGNLHRHLQKTCKTVGRVRNKIDDFWVQHDPLNE